METAITQTSLLDTVKGRMKMIYDRQGKGVTVISGPKYVNEIKKVWSVRSHTTCQTFEKLRRRRPIR